MKISEFEIRYSDGICMYPYSLYIKFDMTGEEHNISSLFEKITDSKCRDIVLVGSNLYVDELSWLLPRLLADRYHISCMTIIDMMSHLSVNRYIIVTDISGFKRRIDKFKVLGENDVVVLRAENPNEVTAVRNLCQSNKIVAGLAFDSTFITHKQIIDAGVFNVGSYGGYII